MLARKEVELAKTELKAYLSPSSQWRKGLGVAASLRNGDSPYPPVFVRSLLLRLTVVCVRPG